LAQGTRRTVLADFHTGRLWVLAATDLTARGLDIAGLPAVLNYALPRSVVAYTHHIGRTRRAGVAVSFATPGSEAPFRLVPKRQQRRVPRERVPGFEPVAVPAASSAAAADGGRIKGRRKSKKNEAREAAGQASKR
jgi:superfamily II DNA/RNA helicase